MSTNRQAFTSVPNQPQQKKPLPSSRKGKRRLRFRPNKEGMLALLALLLIVAALITLVILTGKAIFDAAKRGDPASSTATSPKETTAKTETSAQTTAPEKPPVAKWNDGFSLRTVYNDELSRGALTLVNFETPCQNVSAVRQELTPLYHADGHNTVYVLNTADVKIHQTVYEPLCKMLSALLAACPDSLAADRILISGGYRTLAKQTELYDAALGTADESLTARPGESEHHTGLAVDLRVYTEGGETVRLRANEQAWMAENCAKYGFILRYAEEKAELTGIGGEAWHFRYVGIPHAAYMTEHDLCLEEYLALLAASHAYPSSPLQLTEDVYTYYVPAEVGTMTEVPVPPKDKGAYEISGNNRDGFLVTVTAK